MTTKNILLSCPYKLTPLETAVPTPDVPPEEVQRLKGRKKLDANDLSTLHGIDGFREWFGAQTGTFVHWSDCPAVSVGRLRRLYPEMRKSIIEGLLRRGEIMNIIAAPKMGKCACEHTLLPNPETGVWETIADVYKKDSGVVSFDGGKLINKKASYWIHSGIQECLRVETRLNYGIEVTPEHKFLTPSGWVETQDLRPGCQIASAAFIPEPTNFKSLKDAEIGLIAALLSEGGYTQGTINFTNADEDYIRAVSSFALQCGYEISKCPKYSYRLLGGRRFPTRELLNKYKMGSCGARTKRVPKEIFQLTNQQLKLFLSIFWWGDGGKDGEITLASEGFVDDIRRLFLRFGVVMKKRFRIAKCKGVSFPAYRLMVERWCIEKFKKVVDQIDGKKYKSIQRIGDTKRGTNDFIFTTEEITTSIRRAMAEYKLRHPGKKRGLIVDTLKAMGRYNGRSGSQTLKSLTNRSGRGKISRKALRALITTADGLLDDLAWLASPHIIFDTVTDVRPVGTRETYDLTVDQTHNYVADGYVVHNSMIVLNLVMSVISGGKFLGAFQCAKGRTLVIDNELHRETIAHRVPEVATALNIPLERVDSMIDYIPLRGELVDLVKLESIIKSIKSGYYKVIVLDAFYKFLPQDTDENSNANMANLYNLLDKYAENLDSALVLIHHTSKGLQSGRDITDVGAGAGAQSRAADTHLILRPHEDEGLVIIDAAVRSFRPPEPFCARMRYPHWEIDKEADPTKLKGMAGQREREERKERKQKQVETELQLKDRLLSQITKPMNPADIQQAGIALGIKWSKNLCLSWINQVVGASKLTRLTVQRGNVAATYGPVGAQDSSKVNDTPAAQTDSIVIESSLIDEPTDETQIEGVD